MFSPKASPTPSPAKYSVSAKWSRSERGMSAPCPAWLSPSMSSPCPWSGNEQAMSAGSPRPCPVRVCVLPMSLEMSTSDPQKSLHSPQTGAGHVRKSPQKFHKLDTSCPHSSPQRRLVDEHLPATKCPCRGPVMSALWPVSVRIKST
jgi:hypothetical protein